jgi:hypothetical protein
MWWKDLKWKIIIALTILVILGIIIGKTFVCIKEVVTLLLMPFFFIIGSIVGTQVKKKK